MKKQKIFYFHSGNKVEVKPELIKTKYQIKIGREIIIFEVEDSDTEKTRKIINKQIDRLLLN